MRILANNIRYILKMEAGAADHFTKIAENDMAIIEITNGKPMDLEFSPCFIFSPCKKLLPLILLQVLVPGTIRELEIILRQSSTLYYPLS
jgi:hypothetical protein